MLHRVDKQRHHDPLMHEIGEYALHHPHIPSQWRTRIRPLGDDPVWLSYVFAILTTALVFIFTQYLFITLPRDSGIRFTTGLLLGGCAVLCALFWGWGPALPTVLMTVVAIVFHISEDPVLSSTLRDYLFVCISTIVGFGALCFIVGAISVGWAYAIERYRRLTERSQQTKEDLSKIARQNDEFVSIASHELRTPLTSLQLAMSLLRRQLPENLPRELTANDVQRIHTYVTMFYTQTIRIAQLVNMLTDSALISDRKLEIKQQNVNIVQIVDETVEEVRMLFPSRTVRFKRPVIEYAVYVDPMRISQALHEYLSNACKFSAEDEHVTVTLHQDATMIYITVHDGGAGIQADRVDQVWDRFYHDATGQRSHSSDVGLGLGLYTTRRIVEQHGGKVGVRTALGGGSAFWMAFPYTPTEAQAADSLRAVKIADVE